MTIDAMGCQREIAEKIIAAEADYTLSLKANQLKIFADVQALFQGETRTKIYKTCDKEHGREENRRSFIIDNIDGLIEKHPCGWPQISRSRQFDYNDKRLSTR